MKKKKFLPIMLTIVILSLAFSSCSTTSLPVATLTPYIIVITFTPTMDMGPVMTEAASTIYAALTGTASAIPTDTPTVTPTATETPTNTYTPSKTFTNTVYYPPTPVRTNTPKPPTATATNSGWSCEVTWQLVENNQEFSPHEAFDGRWKIKNTGSQTWQAIDVDYRYMSGTEMQDGNKVFDLPNDVAPGESITITVDMTAPGTTGHFETFWALARHSDGFCSLPVRINVK